MKISAFRKYMKPSQNSALSYDLTQVSALNNEFWDGFIIRVPRKTPGRPKEAGSFRDIVGKLGVDAKAVRNTEWHVETADAFPFIQS